MTVTVSAVDDRPLLRPTKSGGWRGDHRVMTMGLVIRRSRRRMGLTQRVLADLSTVSVRAIRDIESDRVDSPRSDTVRLLAVALRTDEATLVQQTSVRGQPTGDQRSPSGKEMFAAECEYTADCQELEDHGRSEEQPTVSGTCLRLGPPPMTAAGIIGREQETSLLVTRLLQDGQRLITITGVSGVGKTRLAMEMARQIDSLAGARVRWLSQGDEHPAGGSADRHRPDCLSGPRATGGPASPFTVDREIVTAAAGGRPLLADGEPGCLAEEIGEGPVLLVVDGFDDGPGGADWLAELLRLRPQLSIVCSASAPLEVPGEWVLPLAPLELPSAGSDLADLANLGAVPSVRLLTSDIQQIWPFFRLSHANAPAIAEVCRLLDGLPHALAQAASACLMDSPADMLRQAARDPFSMSSPLFGDGGSDLRQTLQSYVGSLEPVPGDLLHLLAKLEGDWTVEEAAYQIGADRDDLAELVHALAMRGMLCGTDGHEPPRFRLLNLFRSLIV